MDTAFKSTWRSRTVIGLLAAMIGIFGAVGCGDMALEDENTATEDDALSTQISGVTFKTQMQNKFLGAQNNGGGAVIATATMAQAWENFTIIDKNGGSLESGDLIYIKAGNGQYFQAANGGGSSMNAASGNQLDWETFRIVKQNGSGGIGSGEVIGLQTYTSGKWVSAENGGGGAVVANGPAFSDWEKLVIGIAPANKPVSGVTFKTQLQSRFVGAQNNGGGAIIATATAAQAWETFTLVDKNGGSLESGDLVHIKAGNGQYFQAVNGGGSSMNAASSNQLDWETFRIVKQNGSGTIGSGDVIGLQTITSGMWVSAENGGGGQVFAYGPTFSTWEKLVIGIGTVPSQPQPPQSSWHLVWADEFNGSSIDESKWNWEVQHPGWVNHELQNYTDHRAENARVENGHLVIEGRRDWYNGYEYSSARLKTQGKASWTYGRVEARIKLSGGWGTWPAFWMMPDNQSRGWPACGEIDIMEEVGFDQDSIHATTHSAAYNWKSNNQRTAATNVTGVTSDYHLYALEWYPDHIDMFVDGQKYFTSKNDNTGDDAWPFNKNFHVILNLAIGGDWGGAHGVDPNIWPRQMLVDYVRVYQQ